MDCEGQAERGLADNALRFQPLFKNFPIVGFQQRFNLVTDLRRIEIYLYCSVSPIPFATMTNREWGQIGNNYLKSLFAVGFQGMLILVCVAIYAVLIQGIATGGDPIGAIWGTVGYTVLLCFMLFKTGGIAQRIFGAH